MKLYGANEYLIYESAKCLHKMVHLKKEQSV